jgi:hypothetical protein
MLLFLLPMRMLLSLLPCLQVVISEDEDGIETFVAPTPNKITSVRLIQSTAVGSLLESKMRDSSVASKGRLRNSIYFFAEMLHISPCFPS